jgi:hypothetical protein
MSWPIGPDYNDAIQNPQVNLRDPCLRRGRIATNKLGLPVVDSGNFASVFQVSDGPQRWAVKCFTRHIRDQQERYKAISDHLKAHALPFTVEFDYQPEGILVRGAWYPLLRMQWVDGPLLDAYVRTQLNNKQALQQLATKWLSLIESLQKSGIAHGDLQFGNIKVVGGDIRLIDYDGMYVPALKQKGSTETGHQNFQHPRRSGKDFDRYIDNFPAWVIYTSLIALVEYPAIWSEAKGGDDCLIFRKSDFDSPTSSPVFQRLERVGSKDLRALLTRIRNYTSLPPQQVPPLDINTRASTSTAGSREMPPPRTATGGGLPDWIPTPPAAAEDRRTTHRVDALRPSLRGEELSTSQYCLVLAGVFTVVGTLAGSSFAVPWPITLLLVATAWAAALVVVDYKHRAFCNRTKLREQNKRLEDTTKQLADLAIRRRSLDSRHMEEMARVKRAEQDIAEHSANVAHASRRWEDTVAAASRALDTAIRDSAQKANDALVRKQTEIRDKTNAIAQQLNMMGMHRDARVTRRLHEFRTAFIDDQLRDRELRDVRFEGLGATILDRLVEAGFRNAFDVLANNPRNVSGIGTARAYALETWARGIREEAEASAPQRLPQHLVDEVFAEHALHKRRLEEQMDDLQRELENVTQSVHRSLAEEQTKLRSQFRLEEDRVARERHQWQEAARKRARELDETLVHLRADGVRIAAELGVERERLTQAESVLTAQRQEELRKHEAVKTITYGRFLYAAMSLN